MPSVMFQYSSLPISKSTFLDYFFRNNIRVSSSLDPDQAQRFVTLDQGPNCLQRLLALIQQTKPVGKELDPFIAISD